MCPQRCTSLVPPLRAATRVSGLVDPRWRGHRPFNARQGRGERPAGSGWWFPLAHYAVYVVGLAVWCGSCVTPCNLMTNESVHVALSNGDVLAAAVAGNEWPWFEATTGEVDEDGRVGLSGWPETLVLAEGVYPSMITWPTTGPMAGAVDVGGGNMWLGLLEGGLLEAGVRVRVELRGRIGVWDLGEVRAVLARPGFDQFHRPE